MSSQPPQLDYAPAPPWHRHRWFRRTLALLLLLGLTGSAIHWGPGAWRWGRRVWLFHQCLTYQAPVDQVVYEEDPAKARSLIARGGGYLPTTTQPAIAQYQPACLDALTAAVGQKLPPVANLFLHERTSPNGTKCLVAVFHLEIGGKLKAITAPFLFFSATTPRPGLLNPPATINPARSLEGDLYSGLPAGYKPPTLRYFAGQPDPTDPSKFTIAYEYGGQPGTLIGQLQNDGTVKFTFRNGPGLHLSTTAKLQFHSPSANAAKMTGSLDTNISGGGHVSLRTIDTQLKLSTPMIGVSTPPPFSIPATSPSAPTPPAIH